MAFVIGLLALVAALILLEVWVQKQKEPIPKLLRWIYLPLRNLEGSKEPSTHGAQRGLEPPYRIAAPGWPQALPQLPRFETKSGLPVVPTENSAVYVASPVKITMPSFSLRVECGLEGEALRMNVRYLPRPLWWLAFLTFQAFRLGESVSGGWSALAFGLTCFVLGSALAGAHAQARHASLEVQDALREAFRAHRVQVAQDNLGLRVSSDSESLEHESALAPVEASLLR